MAKFPFVYTPENLAYADKPIWVSATDGDTPTIQLPIRMLGVDAPELHYGGATEKNPNKFDKEFETFLTTAGKNLDAGLKAHLKSRLVAKASERQMKAGRVSFDHFQKIVAARLDRGPGKNGKPLTPRKLFIMVSDDIFDHYGRMLAYINATYEKKERDAIPAQNRPTFNLQMMQDGQAANLLIFPNIPKPDDLALVQTAVKNARTHGKGMWSDGKRTLQPFEFRWIVDTLQGKRQGPDRYCADITTAKLYPPQKYYNVLPENRIFFFMANVGEAFKMGFQLVE